MIMRERRQIKRIKNKKHEYNLVTRYFFEMFFEYIKKAVE